MVLMLPVITINAAKNNWYLDQAIGVVNYKQLIPL